MGLSLSSLLSRLFNKPSMRILMVGLDCAGKTTILYNFKLGEVITTIPTIGFNVETVEYRNLSFTVWDVGGQDKLRALWRHYYRSTQGVIFVIDSTDRERMDEVQHELLGLFQEDELKNAAFLIYANKQDLPHAMKPSEIIDKLDLRSVSHHRRWHMQAASARLGNGLFEGLDWLSRELSKL